MSSNISGIFSMITRGEFLNFRNLLDFLSLAQNKFSLFLPNFSTQFVVFLEQENRKKKFKLLKFKKKFRI